MKNNGSLNLQQKDSSAFVWPCTFIRWMLRLYLLKGHISSSVVLQINIKVAQRSNCIIPELWVCCRVHLGTLRSVGHLCFVGPLLRVRHSGAVQRVAGHLTIHQCSVVNHWQGTNDKQLVLIRQTYAFFFLSHLSSHPHPKLPYPLYVPGTRGNLAFN